MIARNPYTVTKPPRGWDSRSCKVFTLENHLFRMKELKILRKDIITFLELVHDRELVLKQMHLAVNAIQDNDFFITPEE